MQDNLDVLEEARRSVATSTKDLAMFNAYFIGALQRNVEPDVWKDCVEIAKDCLRNTRRASSV